jgi:sialate O-acetylesterase
MIKIPVHLLRLALCVIAMEGCSFSVLAGIKLSPVFGNGMVLQRDASAPVWGTAEPGETIALSLNGQTLTATADSNGGWSASFQKLAPGGPFTLTITGNKSGPVSVSNVLVGDVWLCSGQSNMTLSIGEIKDFDPDVVTSAINPLIHCFTAPFGASATPVVDLPGDKKGGAAAPTLAEGGDVSSAAILAGKWEVTTPQSVLGFTAMGYYFARELHKELGVPVGILHVSYGGSSVEAWTSREALADLGLESVVAAQLKQWQNADAIGESFLKDLQKWGEQNGRPCADNKGLATGWTKPDFDASGWAPLKTLGDWTSLNLPDGGIIWARKEVDLPKEAAGRGLTLNLGNLKNQSAEYGMVTGTVYFNGKEVGPLGHQFRHVFTGSDNATVTVPGALVTAGKNVVALRIIDQKQTGPVFGNNNTQFMYPNINRELWAAPWLVKVEAPFPPLPPNALASRPPPPPDIGTVAVSTVLYNAMITPIAGYGIKGVLWDHGTANSWGSSGTPFQKDRAGNYQKLFTKMIEDWRAKWKNPDLPFVFTQHPNSGIPPSRPMSVSALAEIRDAQLLTWKNTPHTFMTVTLGLVEDNIIHYKNKKEAGRRLALAALAGIYGRNVESSGPVYDSMKVEGGSIRVNFTHVGGGLVAKGGDPLKMFTIDDRQRHGGRFQQQDCRSGCGALCLGG